MILHRLGHDAIALAVEMVGHLLKYFDVLATPMDAPGNAGLVKFAFPGHEWIKIFRPRLEELMDQSSLRFFGMKCGISESVLRKYLKETSEPGRGNLIKISRASNVTIGWLVGEGEEQQRKSPAPPTLSTRQKHTGICPVDR